MNVKYMTEFENLFLTAHVTELGDPVSTWELTLQYHPYEELPTRQRFIVELFDRASSDRKPYRLAYVIERDGEAQVTAPPELSVAAGKQMDLLLEKAREALKNYAGLLFMRGLPV